ncbi:MAG TPA: alpha/beta hydrolase [Coleofasciculaceae cyanobacterium]
MLEKQVNLESYKISYWEGGLASIPNPVLFLPGWGVSVETYLESLRALSERYPVIAPDLPGFSKSTSPGTLQDYDDYANCLIAFLEELKLEKVHLVGHSIGGAIAATIAASKPSLVSSLILLDSTGIPLGPLPEVVLRRLPELPAQMGSIKFKPISKMWQSSFYNNLFNTRNIIQTAWLSLEKDIRPILPKIESPSLVLWGENDLFIPLKLGQELARGIKNSRLRVLEGEYHEWSMFCPQKFAAIIGDFIDEVEALR